MKFRLPRWRSLKTRVTVMALGAFVLSTWSLALFTSNLLRASLQEMVGEQQFSAATMVASEVNQRVVERLHALELIAGEIQPRHMAAPHNLQTLFKENPLLQELFNGGTFVTNLEGTAIASVPVGLARVGVNYADRDHVQAALKHGKSDVSDAVVGKVLHEAVISMAVPLRDPQGAIMGALVGVTNLSQANFLDTIIRNRYGKEGGFWLVDPRQRRIVTATDKRFNLRDLPPPGIDPMTDLYLKGLEWHGILVDSNGVQQMSAARSVPAPDWYVLAMLPTQEAFAPIESVQVRLFYAALLVTLLAGGYIWWILRRELQPIVAAVHTLSRLRRAEKFPSALEITRHDEVGELIGGFNRLLEVLQLRDAKLQDSEDRFRSLVEWMPEGLAVHSDGKYAFVNPAVVRMFDAQSADQIVGRPVLDFVHPSQRALAASRAAESVKDGAHMGLIEYTFVTLTGREIAVEGQGTAIRFDGKPAIQMAFHDITERKAAERSLRQLSRITEQAPIAIVITNLTGTIEYVNPSFEAVTGFSLAEVLGCNPRMLQSGKTPRAVYDDLWHTLQQGEVWRGDFHNRKKNGNLFIERAVIAPVLDAHGTATHYVALKEDITERRHRQFALHAALQEKTALLNEVHHRVKNNLQVITSLLRLEAGRSLQEETRAVLHDMTGRIRSMALVHETLYRSGIFASVELGSYLGQVASTAFRAQVGKGAVVRLVLDLAPATSSMDQATPCGLLVNELISNSLKHGFMAGQSGEVCVSLQPLPTEGPDGGAQQPWRLSVSDTGSGLPEDFEARRAQSLDLQLVSDLVRQLGGTLDIGHGPGASFAVVFKVDPP